MEENYTSIYFTEEYNGEVQEFMIKENRTNMSLPEYINHFIRPLLSAYGYHSELIDKYISEETWDKEYEI